MFNLDPGKLLIIAVIAILVLGPDKLPHTARQVGNTWRSFNEFRHRMEAEVRGHVPDLPSSDELARLARSPSALLNHFGNMTSDVDEIRRSVDGQEAIIGIDLPPVRSNGEMSWVTADFSTPVVSTSEEQAEPPRPLTAILVGDANLN